MRFPLNFSGRTEIVMKKFTIAILGTGARGFVYGSLLAQNKEKFQITAICDFNKEQIAKANKIFNLSQDAIFYNEDDFFGEKRADVLVIATWDKEHVRQSIRAMELGYDILLEKPISDSEEEIEELLKVQKKTGRKAVVCHVLRYGGSYKKVYELLKAGTVGRLIAIDAMERVAYWHQAQAYVRIQSAVNDIAHPTILAKCCHDLDYIQHYAQSRCDTVSSVGGLSFFKAENAPEGATDRCLNCPYVDSCVYSAKKIYIDRWIKEGRPKFVWPFNKVSLKNPNTEEDLYEGLKTTVFGKCVFKCGVDSNSGVVDHQMVQMHFENGVDATLKMLFTAQPGRRINLFGTHGEIILDEIPGTIEVKRYGQDAEIINISELSKDAGYGHGGGDAGLINDLYSILTGEKQDYTSLTESVESHLIGIKAEKSRLNGGITLKVHDSI